MRAAQVYIRKPTPEFVERIATDALADSRVDQVICRTSIATGHGPGYRVRTAGGRLEFTHGGAGNGHVEDAFGGAWRWTGDPGALGLQQDGLMVEFEEYPNAFERIAGALDLEQSGELWITARPGCEFEVPGGKAHVGGASHGALHELDSLSPLIVAGGPDTLKLPRNVRSVDVAPLCMQLLGLPMRYRPGDPRPGPLRDPV